jgi:hypothetical protein
MGFYGLIAPKSLYNPCQRFCTTRESVGELLLFIRSPVRCFLFLFISTLDFPLHLCTLC